MPKREKSEVEYSAGKLHAHCGPTFRDDHFYCRHFIPKSGRIGTCELVEGSINPVKWCKLYDRVAQS